MEQILPSLGVRLIAINSRYDSKDHDSNGLSIEVSINNMINNMYSRDISKKIRSVMAAQWRDGKNPSGIAPFGYYVKKGVYSVYKHEAKVFDDFVKAHALKKELGGKVVKV